MCIEIIAAIAPDAEARVSPARLSKISGLNVSPRKFNGGPAYHFSVTGDSSSDLLASGARAGSSVCALAPTHITALSQAVALLGQECRRFFFIARWVSSDHPRQIARISVVALSRLISENRICDNVLYVVGYSRG
jgi:hypothetical protein